MKHYLKQTLLKTGLLAAIAGALVCHEQKWRRELAQERADFAMQKDSLISKINSLKNKDCSFRFYEHFANGADYRTIKAIQDSCFTNRKKNIYAMYRPQPLSAELIEQNDSSQRKYPHDSKLFNLQQQALSDFEASDSLPEILQNGNRYLKATLDIMSKQNHAMGGSLTRVLENSDEVNEREFKARYLMFDLKAKNKIYTNKHDLTTDFYKVIFIKNVLLYKQTARYLTRLTDSLQTEYCLEAKRDSALFEHKKRQQIDSLLHAKPETPAFHFNIATQIPHFSPKKYIR